MAKRMTDSAKWKNPWYRKLPPKLKLFWDYICDNCDHAGIWREDYELASFQIGMKVSADDFEEGFGDKVVRLSEDKVFIPAFVKFQYGVLKSDSKPHLSVIKILRDQGINPESLTVSQPYRKGMDTLKDKDKDKDKDQDKDQDTFRLTDAMLDVVYQRYPKKIGRTKGFDRLKSHIKTKADLEALHVAMDHFLAHHRRKGTEVKFIPQFDTWTSSWRDWIDPNTGKESAPASQPVQKPYQPPSPTEETPIDPQAAEKLAAIVRKAFPGMPNMKGEEP